MLQHFITLITDVKLTVNYLIIRLKWLLSALVTIVLLGCSEHTTPDQVTEFCALNETQASCSYDTQFGELQIYSSDPNMQIETPIQLVAIVPEGTIIAHSEIIGLSMYMGRILVPWETSQHNTWQTDILLGACTDPLMVWELQITLINTVSAEPKDTVVNIPFQSTW